METSLVVQKQKKNEVQKKNHNRCQICQMDFIDKKSLSVHITKTHDMGRQKPSKRKLDPNAKNSIKKYSRIE